MAIGEMLRVSDGGSERGIQVLQVQGELDLATVEVLRTPLNAAIDAGERRVLVDLDSCSFIDSTALEMLLRAAQRLSDEAGRLAVVITNEQIKRVFDVTLMGQTIGVFADRQEALSGLES